MKGNKAKRVVVVELEVHQRLDAATLRGEVLGAAAVFERGKQRGAMELTMLAPSICTIFD